MPEIQPFPGILYRVPDAELSRVLAPPYDVIPPAYQEELHARDPRNIVRVVLNRNPGEAAYVDAGETYRRLQQEGALAADTTPALYLLEQDFTAEGRSFTRAGLLARFRAEDPAKGGSVLPHEQTRKAAKEDRFKLLKATRANFSPIFMMFADPAGAFAAASAGACRRGPDVTYTDDGGVVHRMWRVVDPVAVGTFQSLLRADKAYIADGHHRFDTALRYAAEVGGPEGAWTLGYFTSMDAPGLVVLPYHRILSSGPSVAEAKGALSGKFLVSDAKDVVAAAHAAERSTKPYAFALAEPGGQAIVAEALPEAEALLAPGTPPSLRALDTYFLHKAVLGPLLGIPDEAVNYVHSLKEAEEALAKAACKLAVLMRGTPVRQIVAVADAKQSMPAKSTFFHPKLPSGLVIHPLKQS